MGNICCHCGIEIEGCWVTKDIGIFHPDCWIEHLNLEKEVKVNDIKTLEKNN